MKIRIILAILCTAIFSTSCATIFWGNTSQVSFSSEPEGALVTINGVPRGTTPLVVELEKGSAYSVTLSKEGYESGYATLNTRIGAGWVVLDILTGLVPLIVDAVTGAWGYMSPDSVFITLTPENPTV